MKKGILIVIVLVITLGSIDIQGFMNQQKPIFTFHTVSYKDGGTTFYYGTGYQLVEWNVLSQNEQKQPFYYRKREYYLFPLFVDVDDFEKMDKSTFKREN